MNHRPVIQRSHAVPPAHERLPNQLLAGVKSTFESMKQLRIIATSLPPAPATCVTLRRVADLVLVRPMKYVVLFMVAALLSSCASRREPTTWLDEHPGSKLKPGYYGGDGSSPRQAVIAIRLDDEQSSDYTAGRWLEEKYPGCFVKAIWARPSGPEDVRAYRVRKRNGKIIDVWFKEICLKCPIIIITRVERPNQAMQLTATRRTLRATT